MAFDDRQVAEGAAAAALNAVQAGGLTNVVVKDGPADWVTDADRAGERAARVFLRRHRPADAVVGEELGGAFAARTWLVDPIDGTAWFTHGAPLWSVSVGLRHDDRPLAGCVLQPGVNETWSAQVADERLLLNGRVVPRAVRASRLAAAIVGHQVVDLEASRALFAAAGKAVNLHAASVMLAWVAAGRIDCAFWRTSGLRDWDVAAGEALCHAAGLSAGWLEEGRYAAGPAHLIGEAVECLGW